MVDRGVDGPRQKAGVLHGRADVVDDLEDRAHDAHAVDDGGLNEQVLHGYPRVGREQVGAVAAPHPRVAPEAHEREHEGEAQKPAGHRHDDPLGDVEHYPVGARVIAPGEVDVEHVARRYLRHELIGPRREDRGRLGAEPVEEVRHAQPEVEVEVEHVERGRVVRRAHEVVSRDVARVLARGVQPRLVIVHLGASPQLGCRGGKGGLGEERRGRDERDGERERGEQSAQRTAAKRGLFAEGRHGAS